MKLGRVLYKNEIRYCIVVDEQVVFLYKNFLDTEIKSLEEIMNDIEGNDDDELEVADIKEVSFLTPCEPGKIIAVGINYKDHAYEVSMNLQEDPIIFMKPATAAIPHLGVIKIPKMSKRVDYEAELGLVIGRTLKDVSPDEALNGVFGGVCFNDVTARDLQKKDGQWTRAKSFDTFAPFGPWIVTGLDWNNLDIEARLNGDVVQKSNTSYFINDAGKILSYISEIMTLEKGDIVITGTPAGIGPVKSGDTIEVFVQNIGVLKNFVK